MFDLKKLLTPGESILWKASLHYILLVKGFFGLLFFWALALYLPCLIWNNQTPDFGIGLRFLTYETIGFAQASLSVKTMVLAAMSLLFAGVYYFVYNIVKYMTSVIIITENRLIYKTGLVFIHIEEIEIDEIEEVHINSGILGRFFNYAYIHVDMRFVGDKMIPTVSTPYKVVNFLHRAHDESEDKLVEILDKK